MKLQMIQMGLPMVIVLTWSQESIVPKFDTHWVSSSLRKLYQLSQAGTVASIVQITLECISTTAMGRLTIGVDQRVTPK